MKNRLTAALAAVVVAAGGAASLAAAAPQQHAGNVVHLSAVANGLAYDAKVLHAKAGMVTIDFTNRSHLRHNVRLEVGETEFGGTKTIRHGSTTVTVKLAKGTYHFYCSVPGHEDAGMSGQLIVS
jgi:plastocyanin